MKFFKNLKKNNKGFSLVELIIVIAIMAVLVGTLAPQYIRYVEQSRIAADETTIDNFTSVLEVLAASTDANLTTDGKYTVTFTNGGNATYSENLAKNSVFTQLVDTSTAYAMKSSSYKAKTITIELAYKNNIWTVTVSGLTS